MARRRTPRPAVASPVQFENPRWRGHGPFTGTPRQVRNGLPGHRNYPLGRNTRAASMTEIEAADYLGSDWYDEREAPDGKELDRAG